MLRTRVLSLLLSGVLAGAAVLAHRTAGPSLPDALLTTGGLLGSPAGAARAAQRMLEALPVGQTELEDAESPPVFTAPTGEEVEAARPSVTPAPAPAPGQTPTATPPPAPEGAGQVLQARYGQGSGSGYTAAGAGSIKNAAGRPADELAQAVAAGVPFQVELNSDQPQVLVMHTHATETYRPTDGLWYPADATGRTTDPDANVTAVGAELAAVLNAAGIHTIQDTTLHDYPSYNGSYARSNATVREYLTAYPSIRVVIDLHRDAIEKDGAWVAPVAEVSGEQTAQVMLICGCDNGGNLPNYRENLAFAAAWEAAMEGMFPGLTRPVLFDYRYYNQDLTTGSLLLEVGGHGNTLEEAKRAARRAGEALAAVLGAG